LPDKAVSLLDTASARVALSQAAMPPALEDCQREIQKLDVEIDILRRETAIGVAHGHDLEDLLARKQAAQARLAELQERWEEEKRLVGELGELRARLVADAAPGKAAPKAPEEEANGRARLGELERSLAVLQGETPLVYAAVDRQAVAEVVAA